jgi:hypothetical protein
MQMLFQDNLTTSLSKIYAELLQLQEDRAPFDVVTPKRIYTNMLISSLGFFASREVPAWWRLSR